MNPLPNPPPKGEGTETGNLWLIGMMGTGKSEVAAAVAGRLGLSLADTDAQVEAAAGVSIAELWESRGEPAFREWEALQIARLAKAGGRVVATGGGAVLREDNAEAMRRSGLVVWLQAPAEVLVERVAKAEERPVLGRQALPDVLAARGPLYAAAAHHQIDTKGKSLEQVAEEVAALWTMS